MPLYEEKEKVNGQKVYYIRCYVAGKQITRHNKTKWIGRDGKDLAQQAETRLKSGYDEKNKKEINRLLDIAKKDLDKEALDKSYTLISRLIDEKEEIKFKEKADKIDTLIENNKIEITLNQGFEEMLKEDKLYNRNGDSTRATNRQRYNSFIKEKLGNKNIDSLIDKDINDFITYLKTRTSNVRFANAIIQLLRRIYLFTISKYNLKEKIKLYPLKEDRDKIVPVTMEELLKQDTVFSPEDWGAFSNSVMEEIRNTNNKEEKITLCKLALLYSCEYILLTRVGETQGMKMKNLVVESNIYVLYEAWNKLLHKLTPLKNRKARLLYIPPNLTKLFVDLFNILKEESGITEDDFLFSAVNNNNKDTPISRSTIDRRRKYFCKKSNIDYMTNHELRHAGISNAMYKEVDASAVADMAGHSKKVMFSTYVQTLKKSNMNLVSVLDQIKVPMITSN